MTSKDRPDIGAGDVPIKIDGEEMTLRPSWYAAKTISTKYGGITQAIQRVLNLDTEVIEDVVVLGLGYNTQNRRPPRDLPEKIWRTGMTDDSGALADRCIYYLRVLAGGGRPPRDPTEQDEEAADDHVDPQ